MILELKGVKKSYNRKKIYAVDDFSMTFRPGVYGLLGPNGAGKSTLMNIITDNLMADAGEVTFEGEQIGKLGEKYRARLGYMPQQQNLYDHFTGEQFLWYMASLKGLNKEEASVRIEELLKVVNLEEDRYKKLKSYSGGMRQRILIAQALLNNPDVLILDEPTAGLDPKERIRIRNFFSEFSKDKIVILGTHVVSDVEYIAKEILVMKQGKILKKGTPQQLIADMENKVFEVLVTEEEYLWYQNSEYSIANVMFTAGKICIRIISEEKPERGEVQVVRPNLEDVYLYLVE